MRRPDPSEHDAYYSRYIDLVPEGDILGHLEREMVATQALLSSVPPETEEYRYAPGKWSVREVIGHVIDVERAFAFRCLWIARAAAGELPSFEQNEWARVSNAGSRPLAELAEEWAAVRRDLILMLRGLDQEAEGRAGIASGLSFTVRSFPWIIAGHELHHRALLEREYLARPR